MNKRKHKKLTVNQLREANNYLSIRCRSLNREITELSARAAEHYMLTNAVICAVCAANGSEGIFVSREDISRSLREKKVLVEDDGKGFNIKVEDVPCTNEDEASTAT
jgi:ABC-type branched-subunit amino acid transport system substrate-binding protein